VRDNRVDGIGGIRMTRIAKTEITEDQQDRESMPRRGNQPRDGNRLRQELFPSGACDMERLAWIRRTARNNSAGCRNLPAGYSDLGIGTTQQLLIERIVERLPF